MSDPYVREVGRVADFDGGVLRVGVDYDTVTIGNLSHGWKWRLTAPQAEEFATLFVRACWEAGQSSERMRAAAQE